MVNAVNPNTLGSTTSLTIYTLYESSVSSSIVEQRNSGLTLSLIARSILTQNIAISSSSQVVSNYPSTYSISISNMNALPAFSYIKVYLPAEISYLDASQITCQSGMFSLSCTFDVGTRILTFSYFSSGSILAGQLQTSTIFISNLINPTTTTPTSSFQLLIYNSNNQLIEYATSGLSYRVTIAANFYSLSLTPNNTINSALTSLDITFNVASTTYTNNSVLVVTFPSSISMNAVLCTPLSSNILAIISCSPNSNEIKIQYSYNALSTTTNTAIRFGPYVNFFSL